MRNNKNNINLNVGNITLNLENIISFFRNLIDHFTNKEKIITLRFKNTTLCLLILILSSINIINTFTYIPNTSALDYSSNVGIGFTFNPTLSISLSSNDLVIPNLVPGSTLDSNSINVSVTTNAAYGYTLSANVGDDIHNNSNLTHTNNTDIFSSIVIDADLSSLDDSDDTNIWGYSYKNNTVVSPAWSNYNGLSSSSNTVLLDANTNSTSSDNSNNNSSNSDNNNNVDSIDFKIAAKASNTQPSGEYTGTINFIAITKPTPMNLAESYFAHGKTRHNGYYAMQDMTTETCNDTEIIGEGSQTQLIDIRDNKVYWATKLADNHCWMTQNLDLDLDSNRTYTHWDTDLGWTVMDEEAEWKPERSTINFSGTTVDGWANNYTRPYSANPGDVYYYTSNSDADDIKYNSLQECINAGHNDCAHYHAGNYYNWSAAVGSNDTSSIQSQYSNAPNSVCPKNWRLPNAIDEEFKNMLVDQGIIGDSKTAYLENGFFYVRSAPLYFTRGGYISNGVFGDLRTFGGYYLSTFYSASNAFAFGFGQKILYPNLQAGGLAFGRSIRCLAR